MENTDKIISDCKSRWGIIGTEKRISAFETNLPVFFEEFSEDELEIIIPLINNMNYYTHRKINALLKELHCKVIELPEYDENNTVFCVLKTLTGKINSSTEYMCEYRRLNKINTYSVITNLDDLDPVAWEYIKTVVFVDDFCGSGDTFIKFLNTHMNCLRRKNIVYAAIHMMQDAIKRIKEETVNDELKIKLLCCVKSKKAFSGVDFVEKLKFLEMSKKVGITDEEDDVWGYNKTEALIAYYNNTPNNTLGMFRKDTENNKALFPRRNEKKPGWLREMQAEKRKRQEGNYKRKVNSINGRLC